MYNTHVPIITDLSRTQEGFLSTCRFVMHTIRRPFYQVHPHNILTKTQEKGWATLNENLVEIHNTVMFSGNSLEDKIRSLLMIDGLNITKAAFVLQLTGHDIGCIDTWNARRMGIDSNSLVMPKSRPYKPQLVWNYIGMCHSSELGGSQRMWDDWCELIADKYPKHFENANQVSREHHTKILGILSTMEKGEL